MIVEERVRVEEEKKELVGAAAEEGVDDRSPATMGEGLVVRSSIVGFLPWPEKEK